MDARITKHRLANLVSYDWLKMLVTIAAFVLVLILLFTMTATRPKQWQEYTVYAYTDLSATTEFSGLGADIESRGALSYDVLSVTTESFSASSYSSTIYTARRAAGQGTVMFMTDNRVYKTDEDGNEVIEDGEKVIAQESQLYSFAFDGAYSGPGTPTVVYDTQYYMEQCEAYLCEFFGDDWRTDAAFDGERTPREAFLARNGDDKRYKTQEQKEAGVKEEEQRLLDLREDYLAVDAAFDAGTLSHTVHTRTEEDGTPVSRSIGINVEGLAQLKKLVYYKDGEGKQTTENVNLVILYNNYLNGNDLNFETVSFLNYLLEHYGK